MSPAMFCVWVTACSESYSLPPVVALSGRSWIRIHITVLCRVVNPAIFLKGRQISTWLFRMRHQ